VVHACPWAHSKTNFQPHQLRKFSDLPNMKDWQTTEDVGQS